MLTGTHDTEGRSTKLISAATKSRIHVVLHIAWSPVKYETPTLWYMTPVTSKDGKNPLQVWKFSSESNNVVAIYSWQFIAASSRI